MLQVLIPTTAERTRCEMKRMIVYPHRQGQGIGRALAEAATA